MSLGSLIWGQSQFDDEVDKATSELRLAEEDIALNLEICDQIRSKSVPSKDAIRALKRRLNHKNPNVQLLALGLTDVCVKNGGDHFLSEVASKEFMDNLVSILRIPALNIDVKNKLLRLIQNWSVAFEGKYTLGYVGQVYKQLKSEGFQFPPKDMTVANSAMVDTSTAPDWIDSDVCLRCRTAFTFTNRKHHCRNCGQVFDQQCSSKTLPLPHFGITQDVRVCDNCFPKLSKGRDKERTKSADVPSGHHRLSSSSSRSHKHRSARDLADAELQRAIQLSLAESSANSSYATPHSSRPLYQQWQSSEPPLVDRAARPGANRDKQDDDDPELKAAIEASLREANAPRPSAPEVTPYDEPEEFVYKGTSTYANGRGREDTGSILPPLPTLPNHDLNPRESDAILTFSQTVQDAHAQGGSDLSRLSNVHEMFDRANGLRPKLALSLDDTGRKEQMLSEMHDKLSQAVRLYDQLLTEQISHPTWRVASQQASGHTAPRYLDRPQRSDEPSRHQYVSSPPPMEPAYRGMGYGSAAVPSTPMQPLQRQQSYTSEYGMTSAYPHPPPQVSDPYHQPTVSVSPESAYQKPYTQQQQAWPQATSTETPSSQQQSTYLPPTAVQPYEHQSHNQQYRPQQATLGQGPHSQNQPLPPQLHPSQVPSSPPIVQQHMVSHPALPAQSPSTTTHQQFVHQQPIQVPPQQHQSYYQSTPSSTLSRHNTFSHSPYALPSAVPAPPSSVTLGRSNTVISRSQPQDIYASATATSPLPAFPTAPTSNPQMFPMYSPPVTGLEQTEKKEVALIEL